MGEYLQSASVELGMHVNTIAVTIESYSELAEVADMCDGTKLDNLLAKIYHQSLFLGTPFITQAFLARGGSVLLFADFLRIQIKLKTIFEEMYTKKQVFYQIPDHKKLIEELDEFIQKTGYFD